MPDRRIKNALAHALFRLDVPLVDVRGPVRPYIGAEMSALGARAEIGPNCSTLRPRRLRSVPLTRSLHGTRSDKRLDSNNGPCWNRNQPRSLIPFVITAARPQIRRENDCPLIIILH